MPMGRNDPCPCGSGIKYKKCCLAKDLNSRKEPDEIQSVRVKAFKAMSGENWEEAIGLFKQIVDATPDRDAILETLGACYDGLEDYLMAAEYYEKALALCPEARKFDINYRLGVSRGCAGRTEKATTAFEACLELADDEAKRKPIMAILEMLKEISQGKQRPEFFRIQVQLQRAFTDMDEERYESAAARLGALVSVDPENPAISYNLGVALTFLKKEDEAIELFQRCVELEPAYAQAWYNMGQISMIVKKDFSKALHCYEMAATARPDYIGAYHQRGIAFELLGDKERALECWEQTLKLDPENKQARDNIARLAHSQAPTSTV
ncbi:MAG: tetratricopeptide repeat protein [Desulfomonile tiedjei]|nr:tetratricopeptide repeat protein [Desulfomonile tiedjei]